MTRVTRMSLPAAAALLLVLGGCGGDSPKERGTADPATTSDVPTSSSTELPSPPKSSSTAVEDPVTVTLYDAEFAVDDFGDLSVVETLTLDYPVDDLHGIYRSFGLDRPVEGFEATLDGGETPVLETVGEEERTFKIGDPDQTLAVGDHVVRMEYGFSDVFTVVGPGVRSFDWELIADGWAMDISEAELTIQLPAAAADAVCTLGSSDRCEVSGAGSTTLVVTTGALEAHTGVHIEVTLPLPE